MSDQKLKPAVNTSTCLGDNETKVDLLNNEAIAETIIGLLLERQNQPITIGIHGDWGAGKSSILEMIEAGLTNKDDVLCLKFNGWRFQGFEDAKIALIEDIVTGLLEKRPKLTKATDKVKEVFRRINWLKAAKTAGGLAFTAFTGVPTPDQIHAVTSIIGGLLSDPGKLATPANFKAALEEANGLLKPASESKNIPEEVSEFRKAFDELLEAANVSRLVVLIDDLDRCLPDTAIDTLEAIRLFLFTPHTAFVVAADEAMIEYAVRKHFPDLPNTTGPQTYARNYLEKLIQVPFRIPALGVAETRMYVTLLLVGAKLGDDDQDFVQLIAAARELLKRPWIGKALDSATTSKILKDKAEHAQDALLLSDQIGSILASGTNGNPRQIKRFLNTLILRQRTAAARGFGDDIKIPVLAKLMLAERFLSQVFDQIGRAAVASPTGICADLGPLEAASTEQASSQGLSEQSADSGDTDDNASDSEREIQKKTESAQLREWLASSAVLAWAAVQPPLAAEDLRPYLFVTKDQKDYFGAASVLGHLASIADQLFGPRFTAQSLEPQLRQLAPPEAAQIFEIIRLRIVGGDAFGTEPPGVAGLMVLVRAQPSLQPNLVDFLEALPPERLGPWIVRGWEGIITSSEAQARFNRLLQRWAGETRNSALSVAAKGTLRMPPARRDGR